MSLSDRERRLLAEMEAALATDDPRLESALTGSRMGGSTLTATKPRLLLAVALVFVGLATIFAGLIAKTTPVGVIGFLLALAGVLTLIRAIASIGKGSPRSKSARRSFSQRLEDRWDNRNQ